SDYLYLRVMCVGWLRTVVLPLVATAPPRGARRLLAAAAGEAVLPHVPRRFLIIDTHHLAFRMHFKLPPFSTSTGQPTSALYGVLRKMLELDAMFPEYTKFAVFDSPGPTFRAHIDSEYKQNRPKSPDGLMWQIERIREGCNYLGLSTFAHSGVEADDVIATLVASARASNAEDVVLVSSDKDLLHLCTAQSAKTRVQVWDDQKKTMLDHDAVVAKLGVPPPLIPDLLAMMGDTADNVAGIPGIGPKTAAKLLNEYGSLESVLAAAPTMKKSKRQQAILDFSDQTRISRELVELRHDVPLNVEKIFCAETPYKKKRDTAGLRAFLQKYELRQLQAQLKL
ncbi:MAG: hypothetical protein SGPRY_001014, partial [Prymnesium sp.]